MSKPAVVSALRVADEAFLVASTIDRCPKTMMLRELVMNALESAAAAPEGTRKVQISTQPIQGVPKLTIWNTGPGMSASELHGICDLAASLGKETGLDKNFGMGAKVASLPSNKAGLRYRSCRDGAVSEVTLLQRDGVYGRLRYKPELAGVAGEALDVTAVCGAEGRYGLGEDWTEVTLCGNTAEQRTATDPYNNDPKVDPDWIAQSLTRRFFRLPPSVKLSLDGALTGGETRDFAAVADRPGVFDHWESVPALGGVKLHFGYVADPARVGGALARDGLPNCAGQIALVFRDEIYGLREGQDWLFDAPAFGFPFAARHFSVFIELPSHYQARPEVYRQFLRFIGGDQRQVMVQDFAALVRAALPVWVKEIIAAFGLPRIDYVAEVTEELQELLIQLGVLADPRRTSTPRGLEATPSPSEEPSKQNERPPAFERPPEILPLRDQSLIDERDLQGLAARYYPQSHQLFVNLTYSAFARLTAQLDNDFASAPDSVLRADVAQNIAAWVGVRQVARALTYSLAKRNAGWSAEAINRSQSPEVFSIVADDYSPFLNGARRRMAESLNIDIPADVESISASGPAIWAMRSRTDLADAEQAARRALAAPTGNPSPLLRRVGAIEAQIGNVAGAIEWARKAVAADPGDAYNHGFLAELLLRDGALEEADAATERAIALAGDKSSRYLSQRSALRARLGDVPGALALAEQAVTADPRASQGYFQLSALQMQQSDFAGAEATLAKGLENAADSRERLLRQQSVLALRRGDHAAALKLAHDAVEANPNDPNGHSHFAAVMIERKAYDEAEQAVQRALRCNVGNPGRLLRQMSSVQMNRGNLTAAHDWADQALSVDPSDAISYQHASAVLLQLDRLDEAEALAREGLKRPFPPKVRLLRQLSTIEMRRNNLPSALELARASLAADPADAWAHLHLANLLNQTGELDEAEQLARATLKLNFDQPARPLRLLATIENKRQNLPAAIAWAQQAVEAAPTDHGGHQFLAGLYLQTDRTADALHATLKALEFNPPAPARLQLQASNLELQRRNLPAALEWAQSAVASDPENGWSFHHLAGVYLQAGRLEEAAAAASEAVRLATGEVPSAIQRRASDIQNAQNRLMGALS